MMRNTLQAISLIVCACCVAGCVNRSTNINNGGYQGYVHVGPETPVVVNATVPVGAPAPAPMQAPVR